MFEAVGLLGASLILIAWVLGLMDELKTRKNLIELRFSILSLFGTVALLYYAYMRSDFVFEFLNLGILVVIVFEILFTIYIVKYR